MKKLADLNKEVLVKKIKKIKILNSILCFFLIIFVIIFSGLAFFVVKYGLKYAPILTTFYEKKVNIASISQLESEKRLDLQRFTEKLAFYDDVINMMFYYDKDNKKIEDNMLTGYAKALGDKYAEYYPPKEFADFTEKTTEGIYYGIGCLVTQDKNKDCSISKVYKNSPAEKAGLQKDDIFLSIDGVNVRGQDVDELVSRIKGQEGTERTIEVYRKSVDGNVTVKCYCGKVDIELIETNIYADNIGYISIKEFTGKASSQFRSAVDELLAKNVEGLLIDCRSNPGGELVTVLEMLDYLIRDNDGRYTLNQKEQIFEEGKTLLVYIKEKEKIVDAAYAEDGHSVELPIVILTDTNTASAAELFTATLRDYKKAESVGVKTYGKGVMQNMIPYEDGSAMKFTVSEYFPPSGYAIDKNGIIPNYSLDQVGAEVKYNKDNKIIIQDNDIEYIIENDGSILQENKISVSTKSDISIATNSTTHRENLKIFDEENNFLNEDWFVSLEDEYQDKQVLQGIIVLKNKIELK